MGQTRVISVILGCFFEKKVLKQRQTILAKFIEDEKELNRQYKKTPNLNRCEAKIPLRKIRKWSLFRWEHAGFKHDSRRILFEKKGLKQRQIIELFGPSEVCEPNLSIICSP
jgi:hypothetical protein